MARRLPERAATAAGHHAARILEKRVEQPSRRAFLRSSLTLGGL
ncbi:molybdopterin-binding protein, partial [Achromobacter xylosoxidans]